MVSNDVVEDRERLPSNLHSWLKDSQVNQIHSLAVRTMNVFLCFHPIEMLNPIEIEKFIHS